MVAARPPPALIDDLVIEILIRLPPDEIASLARASIVCKTWRRLLSDRVFFSLYREIHGAPPLLGFLYNNYSIGGSSNPYSIHYVARCSTLFIHTTPASPFPFSHRASPSSLAGCKILDCRHGRVLLQRTVYVYTTWLVIWDPVTGLKHSISAPVLPHTAAVLCASNGCDYLNCSCGPYLVVSLAITRDQHLGVGVGVVRTQAQVSVYSSDTGKWSVSDAIDLYSFRGVTAPSLFSGDVLFFLDETGQVLKYDLRRHVLSTIWVPLNPGQGIHGHVQNMILCTAGDGELGVAAVVGCSLRLVFSRSYRDGVIELWKVRVIELDSMIPSGIADRLTVFNVVGFAEGTSYIFIRANDSIFSVELKSFKIKKIGSGLVNSIFPFDGLLQSLYSPSLC